MKYQLLILCILLTVKSYGQCGQGYPSGFYHNTPIVNPQGDTLNKLDSLGYYEGLHVYTDNAQNIYTDSTTYVLGYYQHGQAVGEWTYHCKDGSHSVGQFQCVVECSSDGKEGWIEKKQGIYKQKGVWNYFDTEQHLILTERYDHFYYKNKWVDKRYSADSNGTFILVRYESAYRYSTILRKQVTKTYTNAGVLVSADHRNFWKDISYEYFENGNVREKTIWKKFFGKEINTTIKK